jgi:chromate transporter
MREILTSFLRIGVTAYGGPAILGVMQAELQERRQWMTKPQFVEGLAFVNMLPGATATQMFALLPVFERVQAITWAKAALQGMVAGVIGSAALFVCAVAALLLWRVSPLPMVAGGAVLGIVRRRVVAACGI